MGVTGQTRRCVPSVTSEFQGPRGSEVCGRSVNKWYSVHGFLDVGLPWEPSIGVKRWELQGSNKASRVPS